MYECLFVKKNKTKTEVRNAIVVCSTKVLQQNREMSVIRDRSVQEFRQRKISAL